VCAVSTATWLKSQWPNTSQLPRPTGKQCIQSSYSLQNFLKNAVAMLKFADKLVMKLANCVDLSLVLDLGI
jgi:hypothetical protein